MTTVAIHLPSGALGASAADDFLDTAMRLIGFAFQEGGEWGTKYGCEVDNDVFMMRPFCWCDRDDCPWCEGDAPNFLFKPTGFRLTWYKYIGRSMEAEGTLPEDFLAQVFASHPDGMTIEQAAEGADAHDGEVYREFQKMLADLNSRPGHMDQ